MELLEFIFQDAEHFIGAIILITVTGYALSEIIGAFRK